MNHGLKNKFIKIKIILLISTLLTASGCATINNSSVDNVRIVTFEDNNSSNTKCTLSNEEGVWNNISPQTLVPVHRDGNDLVAECNNETQTGNGTEEAIFRSDYLVIDLLLIDACIVSCIVDGYNNAWYDYGETVLVKMHPKSN